jgi:hypothetical protein
MRCIVSRDMNVSGIPLGAVEEEQCQSEKDTRDSDGIDPIELMLLDPSLPSPYAVALQDL